MKNLILTFFICLLSFGTVWGQFLMDSGGYASTGNITMDGFLGSTKDGGGVLTVKSNRLDPKYNSFLSFPLSLVSTLNSGFGYSYMSLYQNKVNFYVNYDGQVYTKNGIVTTSDSLCKENISVLEPTMSKIRHLHGVTFNYKDDAAGRGRSAISEDESLPAVPMGATPEISRRIQEEQTRKRIGLLAQEVERVFPEAVRTSFDGTKGILYTDLVGVLIEGMKELQDSLFVQVLRNDQMKQELEEIKSTLAALTNPQSLAPRSNAPASSATNPLNPGGAELRQNTPNPFNQETEIGYRLPSDASTASVCIYNLNGQQLKKYPLSVDVLYGNVKVSASEFAPGIYIYSLVINNRVIDTKRMTLTDY